MKKSPLLKIIAANAAIFILLLILLEGASSLVFVTHRLLKARPPAEARHTEFDSELGWINLPHVTLQDYYREGAFIKTNSQRFRNDRDFSLEVPPTKIRVVCSGDSFTFGYGVSNDQAWCNLLEKLNPHIEALNMGQGGYGLDQMYLWYARDGIIFEHDIHLFVFSKMDFNRMMSGDMGTYEKPVMVVQDEELVIDLYPRKTWRHKVSRSLVAHFDVLKLSRTYKLVARVITLLKGEDNFAKQVMSTEEAREVTTKIFEKLHAFNKEMNSTLIAVYLPTLEDLEDPEIASRWDDFLRAVFAKKGILYLDLRDKLAEDFISHKEKYYILNDEIPFTHAKGHYTAVGNAVVADQIYQYLKSLNKWPNKLNA